MQFFFFINLTYLVPVLFTFYIQGVLKLKKNNSGAKRLIHVHNIYFGTVYASHYENFGIPASNSTTRTAPRAFDN